MVRGSNTRNRVGRWLISSTANRGKRMLSLLRWSMKNEQLVLYRSGGLIKYLINRHAIACFGGLAAGTVVMQKCCQKYWLLLGFCIKNSRYIELLD